MLRPNYITVTGSPDPEIRHSNVALEKRQCVDEGKDFERVEAEYQELKATLQAADDVLAHQEEARAFLERTRELPISEDFPYEEPTDLAAIRAERPEGPRQVDVDLDDEVLYDHLYGAWLGRCAGCLLGKPTEGWESDTMWGYLRDLDRYPLDDYFHLEVDPAVRERYDLDDWVGYEDQVEYMPRDDDIDYTVMGLDLLTEHGTGFDSEDVATYWLNQLPALMTYTAERVAYRNFLELVSPPESARRHNPYREAIGAQIRADAYGYVSLGDPERAAELAWRDARISHVKSGVYGSMWVAAMLAAAPACEDAREVVEVGLSEVPANSRFAEAVREVIDWREAGITYEGALDRLHEQYDDGYEAFYDWLHAIPNATVVAVGLLYGEGDYERSICRAVQACFDTDCNGATVGSVVGLMHGAEALPEKWVGPLNDRAETAVSGYPLEEISSLAEQTADVYRENQ